MQQAYKETKLLSLQVLLPTTARPDLQVLVPVERRRRRFVQLHSGVCGWVETT
jgi:hypothetical protein